MPDMLKHLKKRQEKEIAEDEDVEKFAIPE